MSRSTPADVTVEEGPSLARAVRALGGSRLREILALSSRPDVVSFGVGMPGTDLLPLAEMAAAGERLLARDRGHLQYGVPSSELKAQVVELMARRGISCRPQEVFLTAGAQQAMDLLTRLLLDPGGEVLLEETVYEGIQLAVRPLAPRLLTVPTSAAEGLDVEAVAARLEEGARPAFLYLIPEGHNPLGGSLPEAKRRRLVELARRHRMPLLEDDTYGHLQYGERPLPALRSLDPDWVFYLGSFSKTLAPALRVGWIVAPEGVVALLSTLKHASDVDSATLGQRLAAAFLAGGSFPEHLAHLRREYRRRRDALLACLEEQLAGRAAWNRPASGFFVWLELPPGTDTVELLRTAVASEKVAFGPGAAFAADGGRHADHCLRLSFANLAPAAIEEGVRRLARVIAAAR